MSPPGLKQPPARRIRKKFAPSLRRSEGLKEAAKEANGNFHHPEEKKRIDQNAGPFRRLRRTLRSRDSHFPAPRSWARLRKSETWSQVLEESRRTPSHLRRAHGR